MTDAEIYRELAPLIAEVTGSPPGAIRPESVLVRDLGADSIDLLDLSFLIEEKFGITIEPNEFEKRVRARVPGGIYEKDGLLTAEALEELRRLLPELGGERLAPGLRKVDLPSLLTVSVFVHVIQRKLTDKRSAAGAQPSGLPAAS